MRERSVTVVGTSQRMVVGLGTSVQDVMLGAMHVRIIEGVTAVDD